VYHDARSTSSRCNRTPTAGTPSLRERDGGERYWLAIMNGVAEAQGDPEVYEISS